MSSKIEIHCEKCGSKNVLRDAWAFWDETAQKWALNSVFDNAYCESCENETSLEEIEISNKEENFNAQVVKWQTLRT